MTSLINYASTANLELLEKLSAKVIDLIDTH
jgi:hypothetical protein